MEVLGEANVNKVNEPKTLSTTGKILLTATGGVAVGLTVVCASFVAPAFRRFCLPYVPATKEQISHVLSCLPKNTNGKVLDIGSGDGRIVIEAAKVGWRADGVELNPWLVLYSRFNALRQGVSPKTKFFSRDLWQFNIRNYNYLVIFGVEQMMQDLERKLLAETASDAKVIACRFPLPNLEPQRVIEDGVHTVWYYEINKCKLK